jgi:uncharacterized DUF497 family protein
VIVEWDPKKTASNQTKHGVGFHEAATVLDDPLSTTYPDPHHSAHERREVTIGLLPLGVSLWWRTRTGATRSG